VGLIPIMPVAKGITQLKLNDFDHFPPINLAGIQWISQKKKADHFRKWNAHRCGCFIFQNALQVLLLCKRVRTYTKIWAEVFMSSQRGRRTSLGMPGGVRPKQHTQRAHPICHRKKFIIANPHLPAGRNLSQQPITKDNSQFENEAD
jgi:hypothetical protein